MKKFSKKLMSAVVGVGIGLSAVSANAFLCYDAVRTAEHAGQGVQRMLSLISEYQKVYSKQEELKMWENRKKLKADEQPSSSTYEYAKGGAPMLMGESHEYLPAINNQKEAEEFIRKNFFVPEEEKATEAEKNKIRQYRYAYLEELAKEILTVTANVRASAAKELETLEEAKTTAGGDIQQVDMLIQNKKTMIDQKGADLVLQAKILELEVAEMILKLDPVLIENPEASSESK